MGNERFRNNLHSYYGGRNWTFSLSTLHTIGAPKTIDRIIDVFPPHQQQQIKIQLASVLQAVISQQLLPNINGDGRIAALEVMVITPGIQESY